MTASGLSDNVISRIFAKYDKAFPKMNQFIAASFLPADMQDSFLQIIETNLASIKAKTGSTEANCGSCILEIVVG